MVRLTSLGGRELREARRSIGMIFQLFQLVSNRTVWGNVSMPLELAKVPKTERANRVQEVLRFVGLEDKAKSYPAQLSGGQKRGSDCQSVSQFADRLVVR